MLSLLLLFQLAQPFSMTYAIATGPKNGDALVCLDQARTLCDKSVTVSSVSIPTSESQQTTYYFKAGAVQGKYVVSHTLVGVSTSTTYTDVWVGKPKGPWWKFW